MPTAESDGPPPAGPAFSTIMKSATPAVMPNASMYLASSSQSQSQSQSQSGAIGQRSAGGAW